MTDALGEIEAILHEIEKLDAATQGQFRQIEDREASTIVSRICRKMKISNKETLT
jgi:hypothetical protein